ncbi:MAG: hypothetical protein HKN36_00325 [Hellea sp.]|nr:hypothetical protein [Hellea sp.]
MRHLLKSAAILGGLSVGFMGAAAQAGGCGQYGQNCQPQVIAHSSGSASIDPMHVYSQQPMGHMRSVQFLGTPSVNITRVHGMGPTAGLTDAPSAFTKGCMPESTHYCRQGGLQAPAPMPRLAAPAPVKMRTAPQPTKRVVHVGGGYDPSKFTPRIYGSLETVPGIAHVPTSIVDRSHANAQAVLDSGMTRPQPLVSGGIAPHPSMVARSSASSIIVEHGSIAPVTTMGAGHMGMSRMIGGQSLGVVNQTVRMAPQTNVYPGSMSADGSYYEKVSGPTTLGGMQATQVICKRQAPMMNVQRQVIGVPTPVAGCQTAPHMIHSPYAMPTMAGGSRYGR